MSELLVVYASVEGHSRKVAETTGEWLARRPLGSRARRRRRRPAAAGGRIRRRDPLRVRPPGKAPRGAEGLRPRPPGGALPMPTVLISVSLSAAHRDDRSQAEARRYIGAFLAETGWRPTTALPTTALPVVGVLRYTRCSFLTRLMMRVLAESRGDDVDTTREWEYTDWGSAELLLRPLPDGGVRHRRRGALPLALSAALLTPPALGSHFTEAPPHRAGAAPGFPPPPPPCRRAAEPGRGRTPRNTP
jgi:menaquinone-dependent protoporphyrinogen oxidase